MIDNLFIGRQRELDRLLEAARLTAQGQGQVVFIAGEPGSGKTALLREFGRRAQQLNEELVLAIGECNAQAGIGDPYLPFRDILNLLTGDVEAKLARGAISEDNAGRLRRCFGKAGEALVHLGPDLVHLFLPVAGVALRAAAYLGEKAGWLDRMKEIAEHAPTLAESGALDQARIFDQFCAVLKILSEKQPLLLQLDDLQWADAASIALLFALGRRIGDSRILIVGAFRPDEVALGRAEERHPLEKVLAEQKRYHGDIEVNLARNAEDEGRLFVDHLIDAEPNRLGAAFRAALLSHTDGHPLFTVELLRSLQERGMLCRDEAGYWQEAGTLDWDTLPKRVEGVVEERIGRLGGELLGMLQAASVEGYLFTAQVLSRVQEIRERDVLRTLSQELDKRHCLIREDGEIRLASRLLSTFRFSHALFQQYVYTTLGAGERRLLHGEIARALEALYEGNLDQATVQLAHHFAAAGEQTKAVAYAMKAGEDAERVFAWDVAAGHYLSALDGLRQSGDNRAQRAAVLEKLAGIAYCQGNPDASLAYAEEALSFYDALGDKQKTLSMHGAIQRLYSSGFWDGAKEDLALKHLEASAAIAKDVPDSLEKGLMYQRAAHLYLHRGQPATAVAWARRAVDLFAKLDASMGTSFGTAMTYCGRIDEGIAYNEGNWDAALRAGNPLVMGLLGHELCLTLALTRNIPLARQWGERILPEVVKAGPILETMLRRPLALIYALSGDAEKADEACRLVEETETKTRFGCIYQDAASVGYHYLRTGERDKARRHLETGRSIFRERNNLAALWGCTYALGHLELDGGHYARSEELLTEALDACKANDNVLCELWVLPVVAELYLATGRHDKAAECVNRGFELMDSGRKWYGLPSPLFLARGALFSDRKDWEDAERCFESALAINRQYRLPYDAAKVHLAWGRMHHARNGSEDRSAARGKFDSALALAKAVGAKKLVDEVSAQLVEF